MILARAAPEKWTGFVGSAFCMDITRRSAFAISQGARPAAMHPRAIVLHDPNGAVAETVLWISKKAQGDSFLERSVVANLMSRLLYWGANLALE